MATVDSIQDIMAKYGMDATKDKAKSDNLNKDAFLQLLVTQMRYQDPLEPAKNEDFLAQMAQFSSLEQMQNLNTSSTMQQAYSLIGKTVLGASYNEVSGVSEYVEGVVQSVTLKGGEAFLNVDGVDVALAKVEAVLNDKETSNEAMIDAINKMNEALISINEKIDRLTADETEEEPVENVEEGQ
ncbi:MAG: flagellar hook assembly protein FlgD [Firmicutes bacterium HGW-Firmicutes-5]|nr:MAG: flagellar hook assembly protein FlgD [Firmicutes bacterium HGW-Firmicutes-5]